MKSESPTDMESLDMPAHLPCLFGTDQPQRELLAWWKFVHAGGVHEILVNPESFLSSPLMLTRPDLVGRRWSHMRIALRSSMVHPQASLCQGKDQTAHILLSCCALFISSPVHNRCMVAEHCCWSR